MQKRTSLNEDKQLIDILNNLATAYQEISVLKMKEARETIKHSRDFVEKLKIVFNSLTSSHELDLSKTKNLKKVNTAKVLITANSRFNGDILRKITDAFLTDKDNHDADIFVIGKIGEDLLKEASLDFKFKTVQIPDTNITSQDLKELLQQLIKYRSVYVYYAVLKTVLNQEVLITQIPSIYSLLDKKIQVQPDGSNSMLYLFEPSGEEIADYLNDSVSISVVRQTIYETELARHAARISAMSKLIDKTNQESVKIKKEMLKINRSLNDRKQRERLTGISFWGGTI
jgi:F0F1-type ATP synthase gamma subunit